MKNTVELIGHYGSDLTHACSAWTSTSRELTPEKVERVPALLKMLADAGHHTPFEKSMLHFLVRVDTATHIHLLKHRIGVSINGESARYKELKEPECLIPSDWPEEIKMSLQYHHDSAVELYHYQIKKLEPIVGRKRAKESARFFLPYSNILTLDVSFNWRSFHHFLSLRAKPDAQLEIRELAEEMLKQVREIEGSPFKHTIEAFGH
jgi:thymidylate synthase (FAD)